MDVSTISTTTRVSPMAADLTSTALPVNAAKAVVITTTAPAETFVKLQQTKLDHPKLKFLLGIGGKSSEVLGKTASDRLIRSKFLATILRDLRNWNLDALQKHLQCRIPIMTLNIKESMAENLSSLGISRSKLVLGIPFYGRGWILKDVEKHDLGAGAASRVYSGNHTKESGVWAYYEICQAIKNEGATYHFDEEIAASYAYTPLWWIGYNDVATVRTKVS
ncbi:hypothetical protein BV898_12112 [Hypsibius exemplaris]|uniref:GH18 domain-containing protein n=1 Tax=Hypsibius exemplaris TaxID=2072580 RepID=A0A1W0WEK5_HYPEX|nr:hypothetical protein BV898_12112 [Hypsibius exemplaris]